jgi:hypothetical protein
MFHLLFIIIKYAWDTKKSNILVLALELLAFVGDNSSYTTAELFILHQL